MFNYPPCFVVPVRHRIMYKSLSTNKTVFLQCSVSTCILILRKEYTLSFSLGIAMFDQLDTVRCYVIWCRCTRRKYFILSSRWKLVWYSYWCTYWTHDMSGKFQVKLTFYIFMSLYNIARGIWNFYERGNVCLVLPYIYKYFLCYVVVIQ